MQHRRPGGVKLAVIALGSNTSRRRGGNAWRLRAAIAALRRDLGRGVVASRPWASPAWPPGLGPDFVNAVATVPLRIPPERLLARLHRIEAAAGRVRGARWAPRVLDLDLVAAGGAIRPDRRGLRAWMALPPGEQARRAPDALVLPHPRLQDRGFVLRPLATLAPRWRHPLTHRSVAAMAAGQPLAARRGLSPLGDPEPRRALVKPCPRA